MSDTIETLHDMNNDSASAMEEVQISPTQPQPTGNSLHAGDPLGFDTFAVNSASLWPDSTPLNPTHPFLYENPTPSFWCTKACDSRGADWG